MKKLPFFLFLFATMTSQLPAEVQKVKIKWNPVICQRACQNQLQPTLLTIPGAAEVRFDSGFGEAELIWKPNVPFSLDSIIYAMKKVGLSILAMNIKVKGTITHDYSNVYINSLGDNTRFLLLGPTVYERNRWVMERSRYTHPLTADLRQRLIEAEKAHELVTIEGQMFEIEQHALNIIILSATYDKPE